jgi:HprK-related kinase A
MVRDRPAGNATVYTQAEPRTRHYRIGVVHTSLTTSDCRLLNEYDSLYADKRSTRPSDREIRVSVTRGPFRVGHRRRYIVATDGHPSFEPHRYQEVLPYVEWSLNLQIPRVMPQCLQLHSSAMQVGGQGVMLPGHSGAGKSTLTAGLLARGWHYLCDEFALIDVKTLALQPYPRAICIKRDSFDVVRRIGLPIHGGRHYVKAAKGLVGFIRPATVRSDAVGTACPVRYVIFPKYTHGARPALSPLTRAEAAFEMLPCCYNFLRCDNDALGVLANVVRGASCYRLTVGELEATCDLLGDLVSAATHPRTGTAEWGG